MAGCLTDFTLTVKFQAHTIAATLPRCHDAASPRICLVLAAAHFATQNHAVIMLA